MKRALLAATAICLLSAPSHAYDQNQLVLGLGAHDVFDDNSELGGQLEWRGKRFDDTMIGVANISPQAGMLVDVEGDILVYGGLLYDWNVHERWSIVPSLSAGLYRDSDDGIDLGSWIQFRSAIEVNYMVTPDSRLGLNLAHVSNWGLDDYNPGTEILTVNYSWGY